MVDVFSAVQVKMAVFGTLSVVLLVASCANDGEEITVDAVVHASEMDFDDHLPDADIAGLARESDRVVYGEVVDVESGVELVDADTLYSRVRVEVAEQFVGGGTEAVDVWFLTHLLGPEETVRIEPVPATGSYGVWFLTDIGAEFAVDGYGRANQQGWLRVEEGTSRVEVVEYDTPLGKQIKDLGSLEALLTRLRQINS